jgi:leucyl-tRNA synthetase
MSGEEAAASGPAYEPVEIEGCWQARWKEEKLYEARVDPSRQKVYLLTMLPYPSGACTSVTGTR